MWEALVACQSCWVTPTPPSSTPRANPLSPHRHTATRATTNALNLQFKFKHNVVERTIYAEGTVDAVLFLAKKRAEGAEKKVYDMVDVLLEGTLR